ncbi:MAG TPA: AhpC/TSA family protein [Candidatus Melainabacteria bacterium]|jgi:peroxiredoxin|nr:AhpC/TSA family protein [Candidatus Melainabacteria bacterium]HIN63545.1 AhpC/TSA family protein [Candidatus Obscuribacterales bacterium]
MIPTVGLENRSGANLNKRLSEKIVVAAGIVCLSGSSSSAEEHKMSAECYLIEAATERKATGTHTKLDVKDVPANCLKVGDFATNFDLPNAKGTFIKLTDLLTEGPVVLAFYRGSWCPFCNRELHDLQEILPQIKASGASLVAISPQLPTSSAATVLKNGLSFEVLSDVGNHTGKGYGLVYSVPKLERPFYALFGADLPKYNGDESFEIPLPATYIIDKSMKIRYAFVDIDYKKRLSPAEILKQLNLISKEKSSFDKQPRVDVHSKI